LEHPHDEITTKPVHRTTASRFIAFCTREGVSSTTPVATTLKGGI
jgi:hypothetical protein